jgi:hypothetical protein
VIKQPDFLSQGGSGVFVVAQRVDGLPDRNAGQAKLEVTLTRV